MAHAEVAAYRGVLGSADVVVSKSWVPKYDDRFRGYGMNKISHLHAVAAAGATFTVMPRHFVAAHEHPKSASWTATFSGAADPRQRMRVAALWRRVQRDTPLPASRRLAAGSEAASDAPLAPSLLPLRGADEPPLGDRKRRATPMLAASARCGASAKRLRPLTAAVVECRG